MKSSSIILLIERFMVIHGLKLQCNASFVTIQLNDRFVNRPNSSPTKTFFLFFFQVRNDLWQGNETQDVARKDDAYRIDTFRTLKHAKSWHESL